MNAQKKPKMHDTCGFRSFFMGGFECSTHRNQSGKRLDLIAATCHDKFAELDYKRLRSVGIETARDGIRWHLIEKQPYRFDFSSVRPMVQAAERQGVQVIWDLFHYGWPDDLDLFSVEFSSRFCELALAFAQVLREETSSTAYISPVNELSFSAWAAGQVGCIYPFVHGRGVEAKAQLVRANIKAVEAVRSVLPSARFVQVDPVINVVARQGFSEEQKRAAAQEAAAMYESWDMVAGRRQPELGGSEELLDIVGANYYVHNQWVLSQGFIERSDPQYRPLHQLLQELYARYARPLFIAETGIEDDRRVEWLRYVCDEVAIALNNGVPVEGICLYPIANHPGWDDDRHCHNGLWDYCNELGHREIYSSLAIELQAQSTRMAKLVRECSASEQCANA